MRTHAIALACCAAITPLAAQPDHFTTAPEGFDTTEGPGAVLDLIGVEPLLRYQQIDGTKTDHMDNRNRIAFRRDGTTPFNLDYGSRTIELELILAESDLSAISPIFDLNYSTNRTVAVSRKMISFADLTVPPAVPPSGQDTVLFFDNLWSYAGTIGSGNDFLWEVKVWSNTEAGKNYPLDFAEVPAGVSEFVTHSNPIQLSTGCQVPGMPGPHTLVASMANNRRTITLSASVQNGPAGLPITMFIAANDAMIPPGLFCTALNASPLALVNFGPTGGTGAAAMPNIRFAYDPALVGGTIVVQAVQPCIGCFATPIPVSLTNGLEIDVPADPRPARPRLGAGPRCVDRDQRSGPRRPDHLDQPHLIGPRRLERTADARAR